VSDPFDALADPTRRRILEILAAGERAAGEVAEQVWHETGLSQPAVSQHLAVLRGCGLVTVRVDGPRRLYRTDPGELSVVAAWVDQVTPGLEHALDALATEVARGKHERRHGRSPASNAPGRGTASSAATTGNTGSAHRSPEAS
jgi:DNA-binding transcriptional ArsR family regulator